MNSFNNGESFGRVNTRTRTRSRRHSPKLPGFKCLRENGSNSMVPTFSQYVYLWEAYWPVLRVPCPVGSESLAQCVLSPWSAALGQRRAAMAGVTSFETCRDHAAQRVAFWIARAMDADEDPRTLRIWSRVAGVSTRVLQYGCFAAGVSPRACRDLARLLRITVRAIDGMWNPLGHLNADPRTVRTLAARCALALHSPPASVDAFLTNQQLVLRPRILDALRVHIRRIGREQSARTESRLQHSVDRATTGFRNERTRASGSSKVFLSSWRTKRD